MKITRLNTKILTFVLFSSVLLFSCQQMPLTASTPVVESTNEDASLPVTGGDPVVHVFNQESDGSTVVVQEAYSRGPGWIAIHSQKNGHAGDAIGHTHLDGGINEKVVVHLDPGQATETMYAMLHVDDGQIGVYEFPGADVPEVGPSDVVSPAFHIFPPASSSQAPIITISDQPIVEGVVKIDRVFSNVPGWAVVYDDHGGKLGDPIGQTAVKSGENLDLIVNVDPDHLSVQMYVRLHEDAGQAGLAEIPSDEHPDAPDIPLLNQGNEVMADFTNLSLVEAAPMDHSETAATGEAYGSTGAETPVAAGETAPDHPAATATSNESPSIQVVDQDVSGGIVEIANTVSPGLGWVAIYTEDANGDAGERLGYVQVQAGVNRDLRVTIDPAKATPGLVAILHADTGKTGVFDFPSADPPVLVDIRIVKARFISSQAATAKNVIRAENQPLRGGTVQIAEVISEQPGWIGIHISNPDGSLSQSAIGAAHVNPGKNENVVVNLTNPDRATQVMYAMLHVDAGQQNVYEFPDPAIDIPVLVDGIEVTDSFEITAGLPGQMVQINRSPDKDNPFLVDSQGFSLYTSSAASQCSGECLQSWIPVMVTGALAAGPDVQQAKLGFVILIDGRRQVTYGNLPLFYYIGDHQPGDTAGQGLEGVWFLGRP